jgi:hypothetical protein
VEYKNKLVKNYDLDSALKSSQPNNEKQIYNFKIIFIFQHNPP